MNRALFCAGVCAFLLCSAAALGARAGTELAEDEQVPPDAPGGDAKGETYPAAPEGIRFLIGGADVPQVFPTGAAGGEVMVGLYYVSPQAPIQGLSMAVCFPPELDVVDLDARGQGEVADKHLDGTITRGIDAEFVSFHASNDRGELVVGILVDATPPVPLNHMYPPCDTPGRVLAVAFTIPANAGCERVYDLAFCDGISGAGSVPIFNRAAVFNTSYPADVSAGGARITVGGSAMFLRGDCNTDGVVDVGDVMAMLLYLFRGVYHPSCLDACDANDDGVVDLADPVRTLRFLFRNGPEPPPPGPYVPGYDPTPDIYGLDLGCEVGSPCR